MDSDELGFASFAQAVEELRNVERLAESIRTFGGRFSNSPFWSYVPEDLAIGDSELLGRLESLRVEVRICHAPQDARWLDYSDKVYAAAEAEANAEGKAAILVWMDEDTIVLDQPDEFDLDSEICLGYRPIMHNRSGTLFDDEPGPFWSRIYEKLSITNDMLFPVVTPADKQRIRVIFQAGLVVVRPERGILRQWPKEFELLYQDSDLVHWCRQDIDKRIFLHQNALVGAVLKNVGQQEMAQFSDRYNYPILFEHQYAATETFDSIENVTTIRCHISFKDLAFDWHRRILGPPEKIAWLKDRLPANK